MARRPDKPANQTAAGTLERVEESLRAGRAGQAVDLAEAASRKSPTPDQLARLGRVFLEAAEHVRRTGATRDAAVLLRRALAWAAAGPGRGDPAWYESVGVLLARCGEGERALTLAPHMPGGVLPARLLAHVADSAVAAGPNGRKSLPADLHAGFDAVRTAFGHFEAGRDEPALAALAAVGLRSPFAEWKLLLRGLIAWHANDDARAAENWSRLDAERLPARLAAPLRFGSDAAFRDAQPPALAGVLLKQADALGGSDLGDWRTLQAALATEKRWGDAFPTAARLLTGLKATRPDLVPRLARCLYHGAIVLGGPDDMGRYRKLFGPPADDPKFDRMQALAYERSEEFDGAIHHWTAYEQGIAADPARWPPAVAGLARALVWERIAGLVRVREQLAAEEDEEEEFPFSFFGRPPKREKAKRKPTGPTVEAALRRSIELAPDRPGAYRLLVGLLHEQEKPAEARAAAERLLERFPDDLAALTLVGDMATIAGEGPRALELLTRALRVNPLDRDLIARVGHAHWVIATSLVAKGKYADAAAEFDAAFARLGEHWRFAVLAARSVAALKAGDAPAAADWLAQARARPEGPAAVTWWRVVEAARQKLPRPLKQPLDKELADALDSTDPATLTALARVVGLLQGRKVEYLGRKTHEKKVLAALRDAAGAKMPAAGRRALCRALLALKSARLLKAHAQAGAAAAKKDPYFPFFQAEAMLLEGERMRSAWMVMDFYRKAERLAAALPDTPENADFRRELAARKKEWEPNDPQRLFRAMFGGDEDGPDGPEE